MRATYKAGLSVFIALCTFACTYAASLPARAESADDNRTRLMQFAANNTQFDTQVTQAARFLYRRQIDECQNLEQVVRQLPTAYGFQTYPPVATEQSFPAPEGGVWAEHVRIRGCGKVWQVNMLGVGRGGGFKPLLLALLPGETLSDPASQRNAEHIGALAIARTDASCADTAHAGYTRLLGYRNADGTLGKTNSSHGWFEEWTYDFCNRDVPVQVAFLPNDTDGYDIKTRVVGEAPPAVPQPKPIAPKAPAPATAPEAGGASELDSNITQ
ncbi:MAG: hypothetical protein H6865_08485 [Rhodospirillales bacterium]|nr:hypothetical protein [Alphaproteobacteria bacterium]MCB9987652.1 hypothetical protein [Rhodospirillales bacterium]USO08049.1 MAG: hypothetical protein H6866_02190 [Rhodospirillales bacterium]